MKLRSSSIRALGFFLIFITIIFGALLWYTRSKLEVEKDRQIQLSLENEWGLLQNTLYLSLNQAFQDGDNLRDTIKHYIYLEYGNDYERIAKDLDNYHEPNNMIRTILTNVLDGYFFNNIASDNTDPFVVRGYYVEIDNSDNCASYGSSRIVDEEHTMHGNPYQSRELFQDIIFANIESFNTYATDKIKMFQFLDYPFEDGVDLQTPYEEEYAVTIPEEHRGKKAQVLDSYDIHGLQAHFMEYGSWEMTFYSMEFITPIYLYDKYDLAGRDFVLNGLRTKYQRLSLNVAFNFKTVIDKNGALEKELEKYEWERQQILEDYNDNQRLVLFLVIIFAVLCLIGMGYADSLARSLTEAEDEELVNDREDPETNQ